MLRIQAYASNLLKDQRGFWVLNKLSKDYTYYPDDGNESCYEIEDNSFWFQHRNNCILKIIRSLNATESLFDIGGGNGFVCSFLAKNGIDCILLEPNKNGTINAKSRRIKNIIQAPLEKVKFFKESIPSIGLFDVLEHIDRDDLFLKTIHNLLKPNGKLFLTVPAYQFLWSSQDSYAKHFRRYSLSTLSKLLKQNGFSIIYASHFFSFLPLPILLLKSIPHYLGLSKQYTPEIFKKDMIKSFGIFKPLADTLLSLELKFLQQNKRIPIGSSIILCAQKL